MRYLRTAGSPPWPTTNHSRPVPNHSSLFLSASYPNKLTKSLTDNLPNLPCPPSPMAPSAKADFWSCRTNILCSTVPRMTSRSISTGRVWPIRCARSTAWFSAAAFHAKSREMTLFSRQWMFQTLVTPSFLPRFRCSTHLASHSQVQPRPTCLPTNKQNPRPKLILLQRRRKLSQNLLSVLMPHLAIVLPVHDT